MSKTDLLIPASLVVSFLLTYMFIPSIIKVANIKHLFDAPDNDRKSHEDAIPTLGGIAIFGGFLISFCLFSLLDAVNEIRFILAALCFIFMVGAKDDIVELVPYKKFIGQIFSASLIVIIGKIRLTSMYGLFGISMLSDVPSILLSITTIVFIINAFNIIDGINLLAGGVGVIIATAFGFWFQHYGFINYAVMGAAMVGAILAFLRFNYTPAKIFMGDSGSLSIGLLVAILAIQFIERNEIVLKSGNSEGIPIVASPAMAIAVLIIPIYDTLRAFTLRIIRKKSPFFADRIHLHHRLLDLGMTHIQASFVLFLVNILFIVLIYVFQYLGNTTLVLIEFGLAILLTAILHYIRRKPNENNVNSSPNNLISTY
jgi:UDP-GlcNAc:undecaprenyl-phosphate GlcNAc-1-phosphate transferase